MVATRGRLFSVFRNPRKALHLENKQFIGYIRFIIYCFVGVVRRNPIRQNYMGNRGNPISNGHSAAISISPEPSSSSKCLPNALLHGKTFFSWIPEFNLRTISGFQEATSTVRKLYTIKIDEK